MYTFGAGVLIGTPSTDNQGNTIVTPSPVQFGILQEVMVDEEWEAKLLYGANQFPVAAGRGKGKVTMKAKAANFNAELFNTFLYGQTLSTGYGAILQDLTGTAVPTSPYQITPTPPSSGVFDTDLGVQDVNQVPYTKVSAATTPTGGQYHVSGGQYTFAIQNQGSTVFINYRYTNASTPSGAKNLAVQNVPMGYAPFFQVDFAAFYRGKQYVIRYPQVMASKLSRTFKNDDFTIPDFSMEAFADTLGNISYAYWYD